MGDSASTSANRGIASAIQDTLAQPVDPAPSNTNVAVTEPDHALLSDAEKSEGGWIEAPQAAPESDGSDQSLTHEVRSTGPPSSASQSAPNDHARASSTNAHVRRSTGHSETTALRNQLPLDDRTSEIAMKSAPPADERQAAANTTPAVDAPESALHYQAGSGMSREAGGKWSPGQQSSSTPAATGDPALSPSPDSDSPAPAGNAEHHKATSNDVEGEATVRPFANEQMRSVDLERASHRLPDERFRIWQEGSTSARAGGDAAVNKPSPLAASTTAVRETNHTTPAVTTEQRSAAALEVTPNPADGASSPLLAQDDSPDPDLGTEKDPDARGRALTKDGGSGSAMQSQTDAGGDFASGSQNTTAGGFKLEDAGTGTSPGDFDVSLQDEVMAIGAEQTADVPTEASAEELAAASERASTPTSPASTESARRAGRPLHTGNAAWLQSLLSDRLGALSMDKGWKVLEMQLEEGHGTMTVRARRDEEKVSIAVTFSDPQMRALAAENADRLRETMRDQYETMVDFSLSSDGADESPQQRDNAPRRHDASASRSQRTEVVSTSERAVATRAALAGARNEWIG